VVHTVNNPFEELPAAASTEEEKFNYHGRKVVITNQSGVTVHVTINDTHEVHVEHFKGEYLTHLLPFGSFRTSRQLAEAVIDAEDAGLVII
jgi:hypothetical protein